MSFYGSANRIFIENALRSGKITESRISGCNLEGFSAFNALWHKTDIEELHAEHSSFTQIQFDESIFNRAGFKDACFTDCTFDTVQLNGLTLIKSIWKNIFFYAGNIRFCTLVRAGFNRVQMVNSILSDFEAAYADISNCFFLNSTVELTYGKGMNGFSGAKLQHCIFYNCHFSGFPLRGVQLKNCLFFNCYGEIGEMEGEYMINPNITQTRESLVQMDQKQLVDTLALALTEVKEQSSVAGSAKPEFTNFAQAIQYLKNNFDFAELNAFSTEADLVYVNAADRKILLSDKDSMYSQTKERSLSQSIKPLQRGDSKNDDQSEPFENETGRFSRLEF